MNLKNKRKWIFLSFLIAAFVISIAFASIKSGSISNTVLTSPPNMANNDGDSRIGDGKLYVYLDPDRKNEASMDNAGKYLVEPGREYYFNITGITEYNKGTKIKIWACYNVSGQEINTEIGEFSVSPNIIFNWKIPSDLPYETEVKYKYGTQLQGRNWYFAQRSTHPGVGRPPGITLVIPQLPFGVLGAVSAFIAAYGIKAIIGKRQLFSE